MLIARSSVAPFLLLLAVAVRAEQDDSLRISDEEQFYAEQREKLYSEYRECTGDTNTPDLAGVVRWRQRVYDAVKAPDYQGMLRGYVAANGGASDVNPCLVIKWGQEMNRQVDEIEFRLTAKAADRAGRVADSISSMAEVRSRKASPFDFPGLPFGIPRGALLSAFSTTHGRSLEPNEEGLMARRLRLGASEFDVLFLLDSLDRLVRYDVRGAAYSPDSLDALVRPQVRVLVGWLAERAGAPDEEFRVGLFDVKPDTIAPYGRWIEERHRAVVGIAASDRQFWAQATVELVPGKSPQPRSRSRN